MLIRNMFVKPIDRDVQGVIIVGQDENANAKQELEEYVVTGELQKHFADFFTAYRKGIVGETPKMGVWISGFFGSGKSHFLKILSYLLENREVGGKRAIDYFTEDKKIQDPLVLADMRLASQTSTDAVLFNIDAKSNSDSKMGKDAIVNVFLKVFNEMQGFCGAIPLLADLERNLTDHGCYEEFKTQFQEVNGESWEKSRQDFDFIQDSIVDVLHHMGVMSEQAARNWCEKASDPYQISIEEFAKRVKTYIDKKGNNHHVVFLADEVGQYISDDSRLMLNMQTVTEELGKECRGKAWVIVTSQQDIDSITQVKGNDFSKIQGRFDTRLSLSSANADEVIKKRILEKTDTAAQTLRLLYEQKSTIIKNLIVFNDTVEKKLYAGTQDFAAVYPFVPYQFNLLASVLTSIRTHGASGKHLSEGERSMLAMFKESAMEYMDSGEGTVIPFHAFYDALENFLDHSHRSVISKAYGNGIINPEGKKEHVFNIDILKTLFMIKYCNDICQANVDNITSLMIENIDDDRIALKTKTEEALKILTQQMLVQKNGDIYVFLTNEEQEINREINSENVEIADIIHKISEMIFEDIFKEPKYRYPNFNGRYFFSFNQTIDDYPYKISAANDMGIQILTPAGGYAEEDSTMFHILSGEKPNVLIVLPDDRTFMDEVQMYLKIEKFLRKNTVSSLCRYEDIKEAKKLEMKERSGQARLFLNQALKESDIYVNGSRMPQTGKNFSDRMQESMGRLVDVIYNKLSYIDAAMDDGDIEKMLDSSGQSDLNLTGGTEENSHALTDVFQFVKDNTRNHMKISMKAVRDHFLKAPYGFVEDDVKWLVACLFRKGDLSFTVNGISVTLQNKSGREISELIGKKANLEKLLMEPRERVPEQEKKRVRTVMKELFHSAGVHEDEDSVMATFQTRSKTFLDELNTIKREYNDIHYPGRPVLEKGIMLFQQIVREQNAKEFFHTAAGITDDLLDFFDDYEPLKAFFKGEQKEIFKKALDILKIYQDSEVYITDQKLKSIVGEIHSIVKAEHPYQNIPKLPELRDQFLQSYNEILQQQEGPVFQYIEGAENRVMDILDKKAYRADKQDGYQRQFDRLKEQAGHTNNIKELLSLKDQAEALKIRMLTEMDQLDAHAAQKAAEEKRAKQPALQINGKIASEKTDGYPDVPSQPIIRQSRRVSIKSVINTSSWRLESEADVDSYVEALRKNLKAELQDDTILNIEF